MKRIAPIAGEIVLLLLAASASAKPGEGWFWYRHIARQCEPVGPGFSPMKVAQAWVYPDLANPPPIMAVHNLTFNANGMPVSHYKTRAGNIRITWGDDAEPIEFDFIIGADSYGGDTSTNYYWGKARCEAAPETAQERKADNELVQ